MRLRLAIVVLGVCLWLGGIGARLCELQVSRHEEYASRAREQHFAVVDLEPPRGTIYDARGRELAVSVPVDSAFAVPYEVADAAATARRIAQLLDLDAATLRSRLESGRAFVWVARQLDQPQAEALRELDLPGIYFRQETKRYYPMGEVAGQVLGFVGTDDDGLGGVESMYEAALEGELAQQRVLRDARRRLLFEPSFAAVKPAPGADLQLTIDAAIQTIVERELKAAVTQYRATAGTAVVLDPNSGAILAMASVPTFDPNRFRRSRPEARRIRAVTDTYEPGSTFKAITASAAIEHSLIDPLDVLDCENGSIRLDRVRINDHKPFDELTFREVIARSSNVGTIKIGLRVGKERLYEKIRSFGLGARSGVDLPGESPGIVWPLESWRPRTIAYVSFGQAISTTPLQVANAFAAIANGGTRYQPYVVASRTLGDETERAEPRILGRAISTSTAQTVERMLELVVSDGTGKRAAVPGYRVAGKTGTAQKAIDGAYSPDKFVASFVGFTPARSPKLVCLVAIDEPRGSIHGGSVAAPVFSKIAQATLLYLGVPPHDPRFELLDPSAAEPGVRTAERRAWARGLDDPAAAVERLPTGADEVPDLRGLTARRAVARTAELGLAVTLHGNGLVASQSLDPGTPLDEGNVLELWLEGGRS